MVMRNSGTTPAAVRLQNTVSDNSNGTAILTFGHHSNNSNQTNESLRTVGFDRLK